MAGLLAVVTASTEEYNNLAEAIENAEGSADKMRETMEDNLKGDYEKMVSATKDVMIGFGEAMEPMARSITQTLTKTITGFSNLSTTSKRTLVNITALGMGTGVLFKGLGLVTGGIAKFTKNMNDTSTVAGKITRSMRSLNALMGGSKLATAGLTLGIGTLAVGLVALITHLATAESRLRDFNQAVANNIKESQERVKTNNEDIKNAKNAMKEIEDLEAKLNKTKGKNERLELEKEIIEKKQELINIMPEVAKGMDAETSSQHELNRALDEYIKTKERENQLETRKQTNEARKFIAENKMNSGKANGTLGSVLQADKDVEFLRKEIEELAKLEESASVTLGNGKEKIVADHKEVLNKNLIEYEDRYDKQMALAQQTYEAYKILDEVGQASDSQKEYIKNFENMNQLAKDYKTNLDQIPELTFEKGSAKSSKEEIQKFKEEIGAAGDSFKNLSKNAQESTNKMINDVYSGKLTVSDFKNVMNEFELASKKAYGENEKAVKKSMDKTLESFSKGEITLEEFKNTMNSTSNFNENRLRKMSDVGKNSLKTLLEKFNNGDIPIKSFSSSVDSVEKLFSINTSKMSKKSKDFINNIGKDFVDGKIPLENFEQTVNSMALYAEQDFSRLDKKSQETLDRLMIKLPEGGQAVTDFELAVNGMAIKSSIDMDNFDKVTQTAINNVITKFNDNKMTAQEFSDAMSLMSMLSSDAMARLDESSRNALNNLINDFNNNKITAGQFADGIMSSLGIAGTKISSFSEEGQAELLGLIGQFLSGSLSVEDLQKKVDALKNNPEFGVQVGKTMGDVGTSADVAKGKVDGVSKSINAIPPKKTSTIEINTIKTETKIQKSGKQGGSGDYSDKHAGKPSKTSIINNSMPIGVERGISENNNTNIMTLSDAPSSIASTTEFNPLTRASKSSKLSTKSTSSSKSKSDRERELEEQKRKEEEAQREREQMERNANSAIESLRNKLYSALKAKIEKQKQAEIDLQDSRIKALQKEKDLLNNEQETDYKKKLDALKEEKKLWQQNDSAFAKEKIKELEEKIKQAEKDLRNKQIDDEIDKIEKEKEAIEKSYEERLSDKNLYNEANKLLLSKNLGEMKNLLVEYSPEFDKIGILFGQTLGDAMAQEIQEAINGINFQQGFRDKFEEIKNWWEDPINNPKWGSSANVNSSNSNSSNTSSSGNTSNGKKGKVTTGTLNVRENAGTNYKAIGKVYKNEEVSIISEKNGWYQIEYWSDAYKKNRKGWVSSAYIQKFHAGGIVGKMSSDEGIAMVQSGERILSRKQTDSFEKLTNWLPNFENIVSKFSNIKANGDINNNNITVKNEWNIENNTPFDVQKTNANIEQVFKSEMRRFGKLKR